MLTYLLAWAVAFGSFGLYLTAFFFPELHRKNDLILSGVGLFFALTLWIYADRLRGGLLLGETAAVVLIFWFAWQSFKYRQQLTDPKLKTDASQAQELFQAIKSVLPGQKSETDGVPTSKIAGQISEWVSKVDLDKLKGQFQGVFQKAPLPSPKAIDPSVTSEIPGSETALDEFADEIETVAEVQTTAVEVETVSPDLEDQAVTEPVAAESTEINVAAAEESSSEVDSTPPSFELQPSINTENTPPEPSVSEQPVNTEGLESFPSALENQEPTPVETDSATESPEIQAETHASQDLPVSAEPESIVRESEPEAPENHEPHDPNWPPPDPIS
ncbi:Ycf66 protein N-terminus [Synechococcus sp. PCC 6312]|nr:Ycf66 protein N-terminus [Synechococcus sp. PCC 6312]